MQSEQLKPEEFDAHIASGTFRLAFIGMSNAGKSYRSKTLHKEKDFLWYQVDEEIWKALGFDTIAEISSWIGYPTDEGYAERERQYLELENKFTERASMRTGGKNFVFDTTGSVVHLEPKTQHILKENCLVVHLDVGESAIEHMTEKFFLHPKPIAWCGYFSMQPAESKEEALRRCYPELLLERLKRYREFSHMTIRAKEVYDKSGEETLAIIRNHLVQ
ncbi:hypothetical protein A2943_02710 [Candidatus Adlerbacteria bacterium RIFCSPLOWO2_01_FULL_51_16]|uniref:Shikimate kinase n=1 Tax=Candidatus Adlerbacteria bacterium RIFCSPLOWO2_01_FULL_51_16 TaxID=1797243 RepID=A0A1F4XGS4_9BACT|nr:MAG: hypothetical protein A2943_02710 [Candidatus Adlerbacteria bacterium RIFCSPLOWO2_01_FULL_51_16]